MAVGAPDHHQYVRPSRSILAEGQVRYITTSSVEVAADTGYQEVSISPTSGYKLVVAAVIVSCVASVIQKTEFRLDDTIIHRDYFDITKNFEFPDLAAYQISDTEEFKVRITNNDDVARRVNITIMGTLEQVS